MARTKRAQILMEPVNINGLKTWSCPRTFSGQSTTRSEEQEVPR